ncbi:MAG: hypothetical protein JWN41_352 [Thermoleophilia bacterium]|nr:hypothetical protein [Thermoleophilia bacterium]
MADIIHTMLGPGRPEADCDECFRLLDQYVQRQHDESDAAVEFPELAAHLTGCPVCREEHDSLLELLDVDAVERAAQQ